MSYVSKAEEYLRKLSVECGSRAVGRKGNKDAVNYFEELIGMQGFETTRDEFECIDWDHKGASLTVDGQVFKVLPSPYSLCCDITARLVICSSVDELEKSEMSGYAVLLMGELAKEQLMPKNFPYYNPEHHQRIIKLLEDKAPAVIISATSKNPELAGAVYPFSVIEDGDFDIPSVYTTDIDGNRLKEFEGVEISVKSSSRRIPETGCNIIGLRKGLDNKKIVLCAHIDAKPGTPGTIDNAAGASVLMLLAEMLKDYKGKYSIELLAINGEDYYGASGEKLYFGNLDRDNVVLGINVDAAGYTKGNTALSTYESTDSIQKAVDDVITGSDVLIKGEQWYQSDHAIFWQMGIPAIAVTTECFTGFAAEYAHTQRDNMDIADPQKVVDAAKGVFEIIKRING